MALKKKILLVEDIVAILKLTKFRLEKAGFEVVTALSGQAALQIAQSATPDIILLDYGLPDMDGSEVIKRCKSDPRCKAIPIIIFTASLENLKLVKELGADDGILKPYEPEDLIANIKKYLP
jgi:two-component system alkaline phosphatase synthesis response regulator PhoP